MKRACQAAPAWLWAINKFMLQTSWYFLCNMLDTGILSCAYISHGAFYADVDESLSIVRLLFLQSENIRVINN